VAKSNESPKYMEEAILALLREEPEKALTILYIEHKPSCIAFMRSIYHDDDEIDSIFVEAVTILSENVWRSDFKLTCKIQTFLKAICRNQIRKRKNKARRHHDNLGDKKEEFLNNVPDYCDEEETEEANERADLAEQVIQEMRVTYPKCYEILKRFYYRKQSMDKIARDLGYANANSVKNQKCNCVQKFKKAFFKKYKGGQFKQKGD
jgi:RNA polymerase sigma factor (sigma-70 family)